MIAILSRPTKTGGHGLEQLFCCSRVAGLDGAGGQAADHCWGPRLRNSLPCWTFLLVCAEGHHGRHRQEGDEGTVGFRQSQAQRGAADPRLPGLRGQPLATGLGKAGFRLCTVASLHASSAGFAVAAVAGPVLTAVPSLRLPALPTSSTPRRDPFYTLPLPFFLPSSPLFPSPYLSLPRPLSLFCFLLPLSLPLCHLYLSVSFGARCGFGCFCWLLAGVCLHAAWQTGLQRDLLGFQRELHSSSSSSQARPLEQLFGSSLRYHDTRQGQWQNSV